MTASPDIDRFERPALGWYLVLDVPLALLLVLATSGRAYEAVARGRALPPRPAVRRLALAAIGIHLFETGVAAFLLGRRGMTRSRRRWLTHVMIVGFPALLGIRRVSAD